MLEREENAATVDMLETLADVLNVDPIEFFKRPSREASRTKR
jgi:transcriptional regulator with XRE-family HTH domain